MEKRLSFFEFQSVKAVAKAIDPHLRKLSSLEKERKALNAKFLENWQKKMDELTLKETSCTTQIEALEAGIFIVTGLHVKDLVKKVIVPTGKLDKAGKPIKETKYLPTDIVSYDEERKQFFISLPEETAVEPAHIVETGNTATSSGGSEEPEDKPEVFSIPEKSEDIQANDPFAVPWEVTTTASSEEQSEQPATGETSEDEPSDTDAVAEEPEEEDTWESFKNSIYN